MSTKCITPLSVRNKFTNMSIDVPCGKCYPCKKRRISGWSFRLMYEYKWCASAHWLTLTYSDSNLRYADWCPTLCKEDVQLFMKRLRKAHGVSNIKYFTVGEYGSITMRPHYHMLLFNADLDKIQPAWNLGDVYYGDISAASVGYSLKYMLKEQRRPYDGCEPYFALMSKGLGKGYLTHGMRSWHYADVYKRLYVPIEDGKKIAMPRYFKDKLYSKEQLKQIGVVNNKSAKPEKISAHDKIERDKYSFVKMCNDADKGRKL